MRSNTYASASASAAHPAVHNSSTPSLQHSSTPTSADQGIACLNDHARVLRFDRHRTVIRNRYLIAGKRNLWTRVLDVPSDLTVSGHFTLHTHTPFQAFPQGHRATGPQPISDNPSHPHQRHHPPMATRSYHLLGRPLRLLVCANVMPSLANPPSPG